MRRGAVMAAVAVGAALGGAAVPVRAQAPTGTAPNGPPDVLFLVLPQSGQSDTVDITYARAVPHAQAQRDLDALGRATGWAMSPGRIADGSSPVQPGLKMTSAVFSVEGGIRNGSPVLPVEPILTAFRAYKRLALVFSVGSGYQFQGPKDYSDDNVQITLQQRGTVYTYQARILNPEFTRLNLPRPTGAEGTPVRRRSPLVLLLGILAAAGAAGVLVYVLMSRTTPPPPRADTDAQAEGRTKIGTKG